jgi:uncharacterized membrane protein
MNFSAYRALARCVVLESLRRKDLWVVAILGFVILLASSTLGFFGFSGLEIFANAASTKPARFAPVAVSSILFIPSIDIST